MKDGLITCRQALLAIKVRGGNIDDAITKINTMISEYNRTIQIDKNPLTGTYVAFRGDFINFSESLFGIGDTFQLAINDLLLKERV